MAVCDKKLVRSKSGLKIVAQNDNLTSPFMISEPTWVPDNESPHCTSCLQKFDFLHRRHHCRRCGKCFCNPCCVSKLPLPRMCFIDPVRQCLSCQDTTQRENEFFEKHLKSLINGGTFMVTTENEGGEKTRSCQLCKVSSDHRFLMFECLDDNGLEPSSIEVAHIDNAKLLTSQSDQRGNRVATGISLNYVEDDRTPQSIELSCPETSQRRASMVWLVAMQKALKMLYQNKDNPGLLASL